MSERNYSLTVIFCIVAVIGLGWLSFFNPYYTNKSVKQKAEKFDRFCSATREAIRKDMIDFKSGDAARQEEALNRFYSSNVIYHDMRSISMCADKEPDIGACWVNRDIKCLGDKAQEIYLSLEPR